MAVKIVIPREGQGMDSATIISWAVKVGETVSFGDTLCEVESEKASFPIESSVSGTVLAILFEEGMVVPVLKTIAIIGRTDEDIVELIGTEDAQHTGHYHPVDTEKQTQSINQQNQPNIENITELPNDIERRRISPRARKLAKTLNLNIESIPADPIREIDVIAFQENKQRITPAARDLLKEIKLPVPQKGTGIGERITVTDLLKLENIPNGNGMSTMRKSIAAKMLSSSQTTAQFTLNTFCDATNLLKLKEEIKRSGMFNDKVSINDLMVFLVSRTLGEFEELNAHFENDHYTICEKINVGFAVDLPGGLAVPVLEGTDKMSLAEISRKTKALAEKCKLGKVVPANLKGGTFTVSNLGHLGIEYFTPILNIPEVAILGLGGIFPRLKRTENGMVNIDCIHLSLTLNHQVIDGVLGSRFLRKLSNNIENVFMMLIG